ncbi:MAG: hypothetical protein GY724_26600, partial [Actinomycetia bacterium]|nr:hypothetical protein [Actinomycetes bacterium]
GVVCNLELHVQDNSIVKATSPTDHSVTSGNLCIKGRFGWNYVEPVNGEPDHSEPVNGEPNNNEPVRGRAAES